MCDDVVYGRIFLCTYVLLCTDIFFILVGVVLVPHVTYFVVAWVDSAWVFPCASTRWFPSGSFVELCHCRERSHDVSVLHCVFKKDASPCTWVVQRV